MNTLLFIQENWDKILSYLAAIGSGYGWLVQAKKTKAAEEREARTSDTDHYTRTIDSQDKHIDRLETRIDEMERRHKADMQIIQDSHQAQIEEFKAIIKGLREQNAALKQELKQFKHETN